jgi:hypothetical protein
MQLPSKQAAEIALQCKGGEKRRLEDTNAMRHPYGFFSALSWASPKPS